MKKILKALKFIGAIAFLVLTFIACDKEFNSIDSDVLGKENSNFSTNKFDITPLAYNKKLENVQVNGLNSNLLGFYEDPLYGSTTASIVTQLEPVTLDPAFGENIKMDSVILSVPYFSRPNGANDDGTVLYLMNSRDSLYGTDEIKLSIYRNNYFLRDFDPNSQIQEGQNYYSKSENTSNPSDNFIITENTEVNFDSHKGDVIYEDFAYYPSNEAIKTTVGEGESAITTGSVPALRVKLDTLYWRNVILDRGGESVLRNVNNFKDYFRGLYLKAENIGDKGHMQLLNLASTDAGITIFYTQDSNADSSERVQASYAMRFSGITLNTFTNNYTFNSMPLSDGDNNLGDEKLLLKGSVGSMAIIDLFANEDLPALKEEFTNDDNTTKLINEARLIIFEDKESISNPNDHLYDRLYVYDINNNNIIADYSFDPTENTADPFNSKIVSLGQRDTINVNDTERIGYKIRITEHIKNILLRDSTNTKLGLVISNNVNYIAGTSILNRTDAVERIPAATIITPRGTVLWGSNDNIDADLQMKLEIFYTEPNN